MAARSDDPPESSSPAAAAAAAGGEIWGTLEELLLACAVRRHGTASWESVAMEVRSRIRRSAAARLTPNSCRLRYRLLHRRFAAGEDGDGEDTEPAEGAADAWVEELRKLRVAALRREVERYDLSIGSLQSKVERLKEERERSLSGEATPASKEEEREAGNGSTEDAGGENRVSGQASGPSCKESNSSDLKPPPEHDSGGAVADDVKPEVKEEPAADEVAVKKESSGESVAGSKEADADKESSDVQSAASPSRRKRRRRLRKVGGGELASASAPVPLPAAETGPLLAFLESVRTSKSGSMFERRLESQEAGDYKGIIRRHVDLEMVRSRLESGGAAGWPGSSTCYASASEFYRDLLLLCANALVFFPRGSPEHAAAARTRTFVSKRISATLDRDGPGTSGKDAGAARTAGGAKKPKADAEVAGSLLEKAAPIIVCRKRSSIAKAAAAAAGKEEKVEKVDTDDEDDEDEGKKKGGAKDKARGMRTYKGRGPAKNSAPNQKTGKVSESSAAAEGTKKSDKKGGSGGKPAAAGGVVKKRNAVDFLKRMKQSTVSSTERVHLLETLKLSAATEQKKANKGEGQKEPGSSSGSKKAAAAATETGSGGRRRIGRPPKRAAAPPTPPPSKRAKDDRPTRKRGKK